MRPKAPPPIAPPGDLDHGVAAAEVARHELVGLQDRDDLLDARARPRAGARRRSARSSPMAPMTVTNSPRDGCARAPACSMRSTTWRTCSSVAPSCITIIMSGVRPGWLSRGAGRATCARAERNAAFSSGVPMETRRRPGHPSDAPSRTITPRRRSCSWTPDDPATGSESGRTRIKLARLGVKPHSGSRERRAPRATRSATHLPRRAARASAGCRRLSSAAAWARAFVLKGWRTRSMAVDPPGRRRPRSPPAGRTGRAPC